MYFFFWIPASIAEAAAVVPNGATTFFAVDFILLVKIICWIALESASKAFCVLKSAAIILFFFFSKQAKSHKKPVV